MDSFVKGELVIMQHATHFTKWNGGIGIVVGTLATRTAWDLNNRKRVTLTGYRVLPIVEGAVEMVCEPHQLRKLRKPSDAWEESEDQELEAPESEAVH